MDGEAIGDVRTLGRTKPLPAPDRNGACGEKHEREREQEGCCVGSAALHEEHFSARRCEVQREYEKCGSAEDAVERVEAPSIAGGAATAAADVEGALRAVGRLPSHRARR